MFDHVEFIASRAARSPASDIRAGEAEAAREPRGGSRTNQNQRPTESRAEKPRRGGPWPHENPRSAARTPHKDPRPIGPRKKPCPSVPMLHQKSRPCPTRPVPQTGPWFKGQGPTPQRDLHLSSGPTPQHQHPWPAVGHAPQLHKNPRPTELAWPPHQILGRPRWVSSPRSALANPRLTEGLTPHTPTISGKRVEQNQVESKSELIAPFQLSPITAAEALVVDDPGGEMQAEAGLPPRFPFHVREQRGGTVAISVALPPIVPHNGSDALKNILAGNESLNSGVARGELVYTRDTTRGIIVSRGISPQPARRVQS